MNIRQKIIYSIVYSMKAVVWGEVLLLLCYAGSIKMYIRVPFTSYNFGSDFLADKIWLVLTGIFIILTAMLVSELSASKIENQGMFYRVFSTVMFGTCLYPATHKLVSKQ